jgi:hypothetical protein
MADRAWLFPFTGKAPDAVQTILLVSTDGDQRAVVRQMPDDGAGGDRRRGGVSRTQALTWNCRNQALDARLIVPPWLSALARAFSEGSRTVPGPSWTLVLSGAMISPDLEFGRAMANRP